MIINDRIYGTINIENKLIIDLINSQPLQRLKKISQDGAVHFIEPFRDETRFEHSVGAWYLSNKFNRPLEEQVASLLHDVPHTAFSHVIDFVMHDENHEFHDKFTKQVILNSEIPAICQRHGLNIEKVLHKEHFYLLDNKLPDISVDRWDYFMRDGYTFDLIPLETVRLFLKSIKEEKQRFYFTDVKIASLFAIMFMNSSRLIWLDPTSHGSFFLLAESIKIALKKGYLTEDDLFKTDDYVMKKLKSAHNDDIDNYLLRLKPGKYFHYSGEESAEFLGPNKPRFVDPWVKVKGKLVHLSDIIPGLTEYFEEFRLRHRYLGVSQN